MADRREIVKNHVEQCKYYAINKICSTVASAEEALCSSDEVRLRYIERLPGSVGDNRYSDISIEDRTRDCAPFDAALTNLKELIEDVKQTGGLSAGRPRSLVMPSVENVPKYDAWVPVRTNFWVGKDMELEPYMPYFGDDNEGRSKAFDLYKDMARDANQENNLSDGEVNEKGEIIEPQNEQAWVVYESLPQVRYREACREAILQILKRYEDADYVWDAIGVALKIRNKRRLQAVARVAKQRYKHKMESSKTKKRRAELRKETIMARTRGREEEEIIPTGNLTEQARRNFCFTCQLFHCRQHESRDVLPNVPIRDLTVEKREKILGAPNAKACSTKCFLMEDWRQAPLDTHETEPWTPEEVMILRETTPVFRHDPCSLAVIVGTRSCRDVFTKLEDPDERLRMKRAIKISKERRKIDSKLRSQRLSEIVTRSHDSDVEDVAIVEQGKSRKGQKQKAHKHVDEKNVTAENEDFMPCYHTGDCTIDSCTCVKRSLPCESTCACTNVRFGVGMHGKGMARFIDRSSKLKGENGMCSNLSYGCKCAIGHCNTDACDCWKNNRACNPDICEDCDCNILPSQLPPSARRCRNVSVSIARHKRTIVGKSRVHGYGLFAADYFDPGDLIGIYGGQLLDTRLADMVGRLYDAKDHTFFFDITESIVIDGGVLGMKSKFCNHTHGGLPDENCVSRLVRVRGEANIALFAKRAIEPGEELKFDYKFQSVVPSWAKPQSNVNKEEPMPVEPEQPRNIRRGSKRKGKSQR